MKVVVPIKLLNIEGDGFHIAAKVRINGKSANVILDTGASKTVFDKTRISKFLGKEKVETNERLSTGLGTTSMQSHQVEIKKMEIGKLKMENYAAVVLDLSHVNVTYEKLGLKAIDGVMGSDIFEKFNAVIDYGKKRMVLIEEKRRKKKK